MKSFIVTCTLLIGSMAQSSLGPAAPKHKFHYGDKVKVHSTAWVKPCFDYEFVNVCGKVGVITAVYRIDDDNTLYTVKFTFDGVDPIVINYNEVHLKKVKL